MRRRTFLCLALLGGCAPTPAPPPDSEEGALAQRGFAITHGQETDGDPAVVAMAKDGVVFCSGALIAPRVVLTAAHCLDPGPPRGLVVFFGRAADEAGVWIEAADARPHPGYDGGTFQNDVALVLLAEAPPAAPVPLVSSGDGLVEGTLLRIVGFGAAAAEEPAVGRKREGTGLLATVSNTHLVLAPGPSLTCAGDSGGPAFLASAGGERLVGVTSTGDVDCEVSSRLSRVDVHVTSFIAPYNARVAEGAAGIGDRCYFPEQCGAGACAPAPDDPSVRHCARPCDDAVDCPAGMACLAGADGAAMCRHPLPTPGAPGGRCTEDADCTTGLCGRVVASAAEGTCRERCFLDAPELAPCTAGFHCVEETSRPGRGACVPAPSDGGDGSPSCAMTPGTLPGGGMGIRSDEGWWWLMAALLGRRVLRRGA